MVVPSLASACETSILTTVGILDSSSNETHAPANPASFQALDEAANFHVSLTVYDASPRNHTIFLYFFRSSEESWSARLYANGTDIVEGIAAVPYLLNITSLFFEPSGNLEVDTTSLVEIPWANGSPASNVWITYAGYRQVPLTSQITYVSQDGELGGCTRRSATVDFDRDGKNDYSMYRPEFGMWYIIKSSSLTHETIIKQWGLPDDYPFAGDYTGDGKADLVVWRPLNGNWYICRSETDFDCNEGIRQQWGLPGDRPVKGDFDGDGVLDLAIWRPEFGLFIYKSTETGEAIMQQWGLPSDIPLSIGTNQ